MLGVAVLVAGVLRELNLKRFAWVRLGCGVILLSWAALSIHQERVWRNSLALFTHDVSVNPQSGPGCTVLGYLAGKQANEMKKQGRLTEARQLYEQSTQYYQRVLDRDPDMTEAMFNIAVNSRETGRHDKELEMVHRIAAAQADFPPSLRESPLTIAKMFDDAGDIAGEVNWLAAAQQRDPEDRQIARQLAIARQKLSDSHNTPFSPR
jgi:tetratricopeptide (TPR) repeat protein